jgi:uncharacterized protein YjbI with pentapeptide repeats
MHTSTSCSNAPLRVSYNVEASFKLTRRDRIDSMQGSSLNSSNFAGATMVGVDLRNASMKGVNLKGAKLGGNATSRRRQADAPWETTLSGANMDMEWITVEILDNVWFDSISTTQTWVDLFRNTPRDIKKMFAPYIGVSSQGRINGVQLRA